MTATTVMKNGHRFKDREDGLLICLNCGQAEASLAELCPKPTKVGPASAPCEVSVRKFERTGGLSLVDVVEPCGGVHWEGSTCPACQRAWDRIFQWTCGITVHHEAFKELFGTYKDEEHHAEAERLREVVKTYVEHLMLPGDHQENTPCGPYNRMVEAFGLSGHRPREATLP